MTDTPTPKKHAPRRPARAGARKAAGVDSAQPTPNQNASTGRHGARKRPKRPNKAGKAGKPGRRTTAGRSSKGLHGAPRAGKRRVKTPPNLSQTAPQTAEDLLDALDQREFADLIARSTLTSRQKARLRQLAKRFLPSRPGPIERHIEDPERDIEAGEHLAPPSDTSSQDVHLGLHDVTDDVDDDDVEDSQSTHQQGGRPNPIEMQRRCNEVRHLLEEGYTPKQVKAMCGIEWKIAPRSVEHYLTKVYAVVDKERDKHVNRERFMLRARLEKLYDEAEGDPVLQLAIIDRIARLTGANEAAKHDITTGGEKLAPPVVVTDADLIEENRKLKIVLRAKTNDIGRRLGEAARKKLGYN